MPEHAGDLIPFCQSREMTVEQLVTDAAQSHALTGIAEDLRRRKHQDIVVGIFGHCRCIGRLVGMTHVLTEVHAEISLVFHHNDIVLGSQLTDDGQLFLFQAYPCRVIGIAVDNSGYVALL